MLVHSSQRYLIPGYWSFINVFAMVFCQYQFNYHVQNVEICSIECDDIISACDVSCRTSCADFKKPIVEKGKQNQA